MSNTMRWRYGETNPVMMTVPSDETVEIGDLLYLEGGNALPASKQSDQGTLQANQETFHDNFLGVAMQCSPATSADSIRVATSGVFEFDCSPASFAVGDLIGATEDGTGSILEPQVIAGVASENLAIGRCVKQSQAGSSKVLVDMVSTVLRGGPQAAA